MAISMDSGMDRAVSRRPIIPTGNAVDPHRRTGISAVIVFVGALLVGLLAWLAGGGVVDLAHLSANSADYTYGHGYAPVSSANGAFALGIALR